MKQFCAVLWAALFLVVNGAAVRADDVTLRSQDGAIELSGTLLGFDGQYYRVQTQYGELTVDGSGVLCEGPGCPSLTDFVAELSISGSSTIGEVMMPALVEGFALQTGLKAERIKQDDTHFEYILSTPDGDTPVGRFRFRVSSTDEGFADLLADEADLVMALREIRSGELALAAEVGLGELDDVNRSRVLALDAMTVIVSPTNPVSAVSVSDLARILAGDIDNWRTLGGADAPISIHMRDAQSGIAQAVEDRVMQLAGLSLIDDVTRHPSNASLAEAVARDQLALGVASYSEIGNSKPLALTGTCGFQLRANRLTIKTEDYPLTAPMFLYIPARRLPKLAREFLAYTRTGPAQIITRRAGFVDQAPEEISLNAQGDRFANAIRTWQKFCIKHHKETRYRCDLPAEIWRVAQEDSSLLSPCIDGPAFVLNIRTTRTDGWDNFLLGFAEFAAHFRGVPVFNQTPYFRPAYARRVYGERLHRFRGMRQRLDPEDRLLNQYFAEHLG